MWGKLLVASACRRVIEQARAGEKIADYPNAVAELLSTLFAEHSPINATGDPLHYALPHYPPLPPQPLSGLKEVSSLSTEGDRGFSLATSALGMEHCALAGSLPSALGIAAWLIGERERNTMVVARREVLFLRAGNITDLCRALNLELLEVGTSNRTRADDYSQILKEQAGRCALLEVRSPQVAVAGFTAQPSSAEMSAIAGEHDCPRILILDGALPFAPQETPFRTDLLIDRALADGYDLILVGGYGLLGLSEGALVIGQGEWGEALDELRRARGGGVWLADPGQCALTSARLANYSLRDWERAHPVLSPLYQAESTVRRRTFQLARALKPAFGKLKPQEQEGFCLGEMRTGSALEMEISERTTERLHDEGVYYLREGGKALFFARTIQKGQVGELAKILLQGE